MEYQEKLITETELEEYVLCIWEMKATLEEAGKVSPRIIPKNQGMIIFNFGDAVGFIQNGIYEEIFPHVFVFPPSHNSRILKFQGKLGLTGISFVADGLYRLLKSPIDNRDYSFPESMVVEIDSIYQKCNDFCFEEKSQYLIRFLEEGVDFGLDRVIQKAVALIDKRKGCLAIRDVHSALGISERHFQRLFKERIGISPKKYARVARLNHYIDELLETGRPGNWMKLVVEYQYHDQSHLINEFKSLTQLSPEKLMLKRDSLVHAIMDGN